jgi:hypothetical protein
VAHCRAGYTHSTPRRTGFTRRAAVMPPHSRSSLDDSLPHVKAQSTTGSHRPQDYSGLVLFSRVP